MIVVPVVNKMKKEIIGNIMMAVGVFVQTYFTSWVLIGVNHILTLGQLG